MLTPVEANMPIDKIEEDLTIEIRTMKLTIKGGWLEYLKDFGLDKKDFSKILERTKNILVLEVAKLVASK